MSTISLCDVQIQPPGVSRQAWQDKADPLNSATVTRKWESQTVHYWNRQFQTLAEVIRPRQLACRLRNSDKIVKILINLWFFMLNLLENSGFFSLSLFIFMQFSLKAKTYYHATFKNFETSGKCWKMVLIQEDAENWHWNFLKIIEFNYYVKYFVLGFSYVAPVLPSVIDFWRLFCVTMSDF